MNRREFISSIAKGALLVSTTGLLSSCERDGSDVIFPDEEVFITPLDAPIPSVVYSGQDDQSVLGLLRHVDPNIKVFEDQLGVMVDNIIGLQNGMRNRYWEFWVNSRVIENFHAGNYITKDGNVVEWRYFEHIPAEVSPNLLAAPTRTIYIPAACGGGTWVLVEDQRYYPQPGAPGWNYFEYVESKPEPDGGIEVRLTHSGILEGSQALGSMRLAVWVLKGYYIAGGSERVFPNNFQYASSIANEIRLHCNALLDSFFWREVMWGVPRSLVDSIAHHANPVNIETRDHPGYRLDKWQAIQDWKNGKF